jgi:3-oxoacyl-[acyl-carrier-protein] synthase III
MSTCVMPVHFTGWGAHVPRAVLQNAELERRFVVDEGWIVDKTGIRERRIAAPHESTATLATSAARTALESAKVAPRDIDVIALATTTPEQPIPHTAAFVGGELDMTCASFDLNTACSGFVYGLVMTGALLNSGPFDNALLIGAETFSRVLNPDDRATSVIFGDGAGALVVTRDPDADSGVLASDLGCEGALRDLVGIRAGGSRLPATPELVAQRDNTLHMQGRAIFEFAVRTLVRSIHGTLAGASVNLDDVDWFVPHQANLRIIEAAGEKLGLDPEKVVLNIDRLGNTAAASIPIGLTEAAESGRLRHGDLVLLASIGAGMTWGTALIRW